MSGHRILLVWSGPETGTSANLFKALGKSLGEVHTVREGPNGTIPGSRALKILNHILCDLRRWPVVLWSDSVLLHSYAALSLPSVMLAWLLRRRIIIIHWDAYPITVNGQRLGGLYRRWFDRLEHFVVARASRVVIPTEDFRPFVKHRDITVLPLWPSLPIGTARSRTSRRPEQPIRLAFVGQAGLTRGLPQAVERLGREPSTQFELHIFSPTPPDQSLHGLSGNVTIHPRGYLSRGDLIAELDKMDFGLISLHPGMGQPGFPSKVFDYVAAGLPILYTGRPLPSFARLLEETGVGFALDDESVDWPLVSTRISAGIPEAARAFAKATELTIDKLEKSLF